MGREDRQSLPLLAGTPRVRVRPRELTGEVAARCERGGPFCIYFLHCHELRTGNTPKRLATSMRPNPSLHPTRYSGLRPLPRAGELKRVCQAWHRTSEVQVLVPGDRGAEGEEKGKGVHREVGSGGSPIQTRGATNRNRLRGVARPGRAGTCPRSPPSAGGVRYQSGVYARNVRCLTLGGLSGVHVAGMDEIVWHRRETRRYQSRPTASWRHDTDYEGRDPL